MCSDDFVHLRGSTVNKESFLNSMMGDSIVTNDFDLDGAPVGHFDQSDVEEKDAELDQFQPSGSSRRKQFGPQTTP